MALRFDEIQAINIENFSGTAILEVTQPTYTILRNPEGSRTLYMGDSADRGNYYDNNFHRFRYAGGSSTQMLINGSGNVGIANTSPGARLHVTGNGTGGNTSSLLLEASNGEDRFNFRDDATMTWGPTSQMGKLSWDTNEAMVFGQSGKALNLGSNGTVNRLFIATDGNIGINNDAPQYELDLATLDEQSPTDRIRLGVRNGPAANDGTALGTGLIFKPYYTSYTKRSAGIMQVAEGNYFKSGLAFFTNGTSDTTTDWSERMRIDMDGNVGIGTTSPGYHLEVYGSSPNIMINNTAETNAGLLFQDSADTGQSAAIKYNSSDNGLRFYNHSYNTERMAIYKDGSYKINEQRGLMVRSIDESNYFSFNDESTTADFEQQLPYTGGGGSVAKVDDSTAPAPGCFEITGAYYSDIPSSNRYIKVDINAEYTWEAYVKFVSGTDTDQRIYLGWGMWDASKSYFGNTQRYWGASAVQVDANTNNSDWVLVRGTISGVGSNTGQFISGTEYVAPLALLNYGDNTNVIRVCGLKLYKSSKNASKIHLGRYGAISSSTFNVNTAYPDNRVTLQNTGSDGLRVRNNHGYIEIGSLNSSHAHIQTDRSNFYFNKELRIDTGRISSYNEDMKIATANSNTPTDRIYIKRDSGNVGIGKSAPVARFEVDPNNSLNASSPSPVPDSIARFGGGVTIESGKYLTLDDDYYNHAHMRYNGSGGEARFELLGYYGIDFKTRSTTKMVVKGDNGFVGIGTTSPGTKLHVSDGEIRISNSYGTKDIAQYYNTLTFKGDSSCQFYFGTSQHPSYSTPLPVHTGKLTVVGHLYAGSDVQTITTTSGTINLQARDYGVFRLTNALTGTTTLNIQNMKSGQVIDVVLTGDQTVNLTSDDLAETFYRIGETTYDGTATNHLQIVCISDANSAAIYHFTVAKIASSSSI